MKIEKLTSFFFEILSYRKIEYRNKTILLRDILDFHAICLDLFLSCFYKAIEYIWTLYVRVIGSRCISALYSLFISF
ncbi:uncharacterized protein T551_02856 [Pneumocystis jirovecii RU7]|uniref:Uncharacterized protein n=1 Tax=Pneumocystis jirovecii (strain RU7) TaxID=1408657 RepID=A0A0W4ZHP0_PNEJ7|nr:uncharacterized protein T551_02856 [Pneumocystis jirovecii RU7]KTW27889.1 hypothetical protein T551_02856 [Pneumocystis jirovecii RU7]